MNVTWLVSALDQNTAVSRYLGEVQAAAAKIGSEIDAKFSLKTARANGLQ